MNLNPQQEQAVNSTSKQIVVSAGAGSGKTAVLTQRILRLIKEGINLDQLIVITFTRASAKEMKERLIKQLPEKRNEIENTNVTTFDGFFLDFVSNFGYLIGVDNNISIISDNVLNYERYRIIDNLINNYPKQDRLMDFISVYFHGDKDQFVDAIASLHKTVSDKIKVEDVFYANKGVEEIACQLLINKIQNLINYSVDTTVEEYGLLQGLLQENNYLELANKYLEVHKELNGKKNSVKLLMGENSDLFGEIKKSTKDLADEIINCSLDKDKEQQLKEVYDFLIKFINLVDCELTKFKKELNKYTYKDIMEMVIKILDYDNDLSKRSDLDKFLENIKEIMVDEYQDTNKQQDEILERLVSKGATLFVVGDAKQSIYGFRGSSPEYFNNRANSEDSELINLNTNYRSDENVIKEINNIFRDTMTLNCGQVEYQDGHELKAGKIGGVNFKEPVSAVIINETELPDDRFDKLYYQSYLMMKDIKAKKEELGCSYSDFCILAPKKNKFKYLKRICNYLDVPINIQESDRNLENPIVQVFINIINILDNKDVNYHLYALLRSFIYNMNDNNLYTIYHNIQGCVLYNEEVNDKNVIDVRNKIINIKNNINNFGIDYGLKSIFREFNFASNISMLDKDIDFIQIIDKINTIIDEFASHNYDLAKVREAITTLIDKEQLSFEIETPEKEDSITACSIHYSKGLEFKHIYVIGLQSRPNSEKDKFKFNLTTGLTTNLYTEEEVDDYKVVVEYKTLDSKIHNILETQNNEHEDIRNFYVALTRSEQTINFYLERSIDKKGEVSKFNSTAQYLNKYPLVYNQPFYEFKETELKEMETIYFSKVEDSSDYEVNNAESRLITKEVIGEVKEVKRASRSDVYILDEEGIKNINRGDYVHNILSLIDYKDLDNVKVEDELIQSYIDNMKQQDIFNNIDEYYQEVEFYDEESSIHGFIDLLVKDYNGVYKIIDYKLSDYDKEEYDQQLNRYYHYLKTKVGDNIECYLYSLEKDSVRQVEIIEE